MTVARWAIWGAAILAGILVCSLGGCAHTCRTPLERASEHGEVLECRPTLFLMKDGRQIERCLVNTKNGDEMYDYGVCK